MVELLIKIEPQLANKKIVVFGAGIGGKYVVSALRILALQIEYCLDNDPAKHNEQLLGVEIKHPNILNSEAHEDVAVIIASIYYEEISKQLEQVGLKENVHYYNISLHSKRSANQDARVERVLNGVTIGKYSYGVDRHCYPGTLLKSVGAFCSINEHALIGMKNHPTSHISTHPFLYREKGMLEGIEAIPCGILDEYGSEILDIDMVANNEPIIIGNDVWIGAGVIVLPSVKIGNGAIIGAGAVVNRDVPDYAIVAGVPARVIKYRFQPEEIEMLNKVKWWDWTDQEIARNSEYLKDPVSFFKNFSSR
ncbi:antibiotic acetyltransferase [Paenibacillus sp. CAU 1523]|uniref:Antibiotic acetyltransferase n=2 Tax=Paenibacillus arenosi TaxID=2774142 RepID=A0ABR9AVC5_9BACL|nr:antibiotic acetyltransferase [Paenibacillus arenosi]